MGSFFKVLYFVCAEMFDLRMRYDESDHVLVRASRVVTDKVGQLFGKWLCLQSVW